MIDREIAQLQLQLEDLEETSAARTLQPDLVEPPQLLGGAARGSRCSLELVFEVDHLCACGAGAGDNRPSAWCDGSDR